MKNTRMLKDKVQVMKGDEVPPIPTNFKTSPYGGAHRHHPLDPLPPDPMDLLGNLVDALQDASLQANPGHRQRYQQALCRRAHGGILPDPDLDPD